MPRLRVFRVDVTDATDESVARLVLHPLDRDFPSPSRPATCASAPTTAGWPGPKRTAVSTSGIWNSITSCHHRAARSRTDPEFLAVIRAAGSFSSTAALIVLWDVLAGRPSAAFPMPGVGEAPGTYAVHIGLSPDGRCLAVSTVSGHGLSLWDTENGKLLLTLPEEAGVVWAIAWSPDASHLAISRSNGTIAVWDLPEAAPAIGRVGSGLVTGAGPDRPRLCRQETDNPSEWTR